MRSLVFSAVVRLAASSAADAPRPPDLERDLHLEAGKLPNPIGTKLTALVKILSDIDPSQRSSIQEGHFGARVPGAAKPPCSFTM